MGYEPPAVVSWPVDEGSGECCLQLVDECAEGDQDANGEQLALL